MGKMILAIVIALIVAAGCCAACRLEVDAAAGGALSCIQTAMVFYRDEQPLQALEAMRQASEHWQSHEPVLRLLLHHEEIDAAANAMDRCVYALLYEDPQVFFTECLALSRMLRDFMEGERLTFENLL